MKVGRTRARVFTVSVDLFEILDTRNISDSTAIGYLRLCAYMTRWGLWGRPVNATLIKHSLFSLNRVGPLERAGLLHRKAGREQWIVQRPPAAYRPRIAAPVKAALMAKSERVCGICLNPIAPAEAVHIDHIVPFALGGATELANLQLAHAVCNIRKGAGLPRIVN